MTSLQKLNIAIVGGGVCGLTLAVALQKQGLKAHIYEAASKFGEIGAAIALGANALSIFEELGVYDELFKHMPDPRKVKTPGFTLVFGNALEDHIGKLSNEGEQGSLALLRSAFLEGLVKDVDPAHTHFNKRCVSVTPKTQSKVQIIHFKDGTTAEADVVLVANGVKSSIRGMVMDEVAVDPEVTDLATKGVSYSNIAGYRGLVRQERAQALNVDTSIWRSPMLVVGKNKHIVVYPVNKGQLFNIAAFVGDYSAPIGAVKLPPSHPLNVQVTTDELLADFPDPDFRPEIRDLLKCMENPSKWYINIVYPHLAAFAKGRVALLGDAAHAMLPFLAAGAGQGIEDAYLLAQLLSHPKTTLDNVEEVLQVYSDVRRPRAQRILDLSTQSGRVTHGYGPREFTKDGLRQDFEYLKKWRIEAYARPLNEDIDKAVAFLNEKGVFA